MGEMAWLHGMVEENHLPCRGWEAERAKGGDREPDPPFQNKLLVLSEPILSTQMRIGGGHFIAIP